MIAKVMINPNVCLCSLVVRLDEKSERMEVEWAENKHLVEFEIGLVGVKGKMKALTPAIYACSPSNVITMPKLELETEDGPGKINKLYNKSELLPTLVELSSVCH